MAAVELTPAQRTEAMRRYRMLEPHLTGGVPLTRVAREAGIGERTARRWLAHYRAHGLSGLARTPRRTVRTTRPELVQLIEGLALTRPPPSIAAIHRRVSTVADHQKWPVPSYSTVYAIVRGLDPELLTLAHDGTAGWRDRYELVYRRTADAPNRMWQIDHTLLDVLVLDPAGTAVRPWLTVVLDDHSRAVPGYSITLGAPSTLGTSLALRQAIWTKADPSWPMCGIPEILYADHGSDFISDHLRQVAADLKITLIHSTVARPQGRGKIERFFGTLTCELLPELPGHLDHGRPVTEPTLSVTDLDLRLRGFIVEQYHQRPHRETGESPHRRWLADGWLPQLPESIEALDLLLVQVATGRIVHRDGIHFQGLRYLDPVLAAYVREPVTIRYDPRDITAIRVFHHDRYLCTAISPEHSGRTISLKDIDTARRAHRRRLRSQIHERIQLVTDYLPTPAAPPAAEPAPARRRSTLRTYRED